MDESVNNYILHQKLSYDKLFAVDIMYKHFKSVLERSNVDKDAPFLLITGALGAGKSHRVHTLRGICNIIQINEPLRSAFMGIAAVNIGGSTLCSFIDIPPILEIRDKEIPTPWERNALQHFLN